MGRPRKQVTENQRRSILSRYEKGEGLIEIGKAVSHNAQIVRRILVEAGVEIRKQGRPCVVAE